MAVLDDFLARIGGMGMTPTNASPYTSPQSFGSAFGTTPVNIGGMSGLPGGTAPIARTTGISPMRGIGFGSMPPSVPPTPTRGFGSRLGDVFKDPSKFADLATGAALISGTPIAEAFAIREALAPTTTTSKGVGQLYDVIGADGMPTGEQIGANERDKIDAARARGLTLRPVGDSAEYGKTPEGFRFVDGRYEAVQGGQAFANIVGDINLNNSGIRSMKEDIENNIRDIDLVLSKLPPDYNGSLSAAGIAAIFPSSGFAATNNILERLKTSVFLDVLNRMRSQSKTGGAVGSVTEEEMKKIGDSVEVLKLTDQNLVANLRDLRARFITNYNNAVDDVIAKNANLNTQLPENSRIETTAQKIAVTQAPSGSGAKDEQIIDEDIEDIL